MWLSSCSRWTSSTLSARNSLKSTNDLLWTLSTIFAGMGGRASEMTSGPAFAAAGGAGIGLVRRVDRDGNLQADGVSPAAVIGVVQVGVELEPVYISATNKIELAGGGSSIGWVTADPGRALPPGKRERDTYRLVRLGQERVRERERERAREIKSCTGAVRPHSSRTVWRHLGRHGSKT